LTEAPQPNQAAPPTVLVQLSDLHLRAGSDGAGPARRLHQVLGAVADLEPTPSAVLLSGDIADSPSEEAYELAREMLAPLGLPLHAIPGNHDEPAMLAAHFPTGSNTESSPRFAVTYGDLRVVGCDSTRRGEEAGTLGGEQLAWLEETLSNAPDVPTLLALHHPPVLTGIRAMDVIALAARDRSALEDLLARHHQVLAVTCGHVHTAMVTSFAGRPLLICPSVNSTVELDLRPRDDLPFVAAPRPGGFLVHALMDGRLVSHFQPLNQIAGR
jgi:3',5'-cyclic AMP phosphodiesterase CpdA